VVELLFQRLCACTGLLRLGLIARAFKGSRRGLSRRYALLEAANAGGCFRRNRADGSRYLSGRYRRRLKRRWWRLRGLWQAGISRASGGAAERLERMGFRVESVHRAPDPRAAVESAEAIFIGGGNTFRLLKTLYEYGLLAPIRLRVEGGMPYIGSSAGSVGTRQRLRSPLLSQRCVQACQQDCRKHMKNTNDPDYTVDGKVILTNIKSLSMPPMSPSP
jgi:hypothetical protein